MVYEQLSLFDVTPYIVSRPPVDNIRLIGKTVSQKQSQDIQLELELLTEMASESESDDFRLAA